MAIYIEQLLYKYALLRCIIITSAIAVLLHRRSNGLEGINSYWVPIYYTQVKRDNCGQNGQKGIQT